MDKKIYHTILEKKKKRKKQFAVLIDPDKFNPSSDLIEQCNAAKVDYLLLGGSILSTGNLEQCLEKIKKQTSIPVILFPGNTFQISAKADGIFLLSLISGRNPDTLIGKHVIAAPMLRKSKLEIISTGYILVESGKQTTVSYISNTQPIPADKDDVAACTAMAGEMLGLKLIYLEAGSGALHPVSSSMIKKVKENISVPLIVGGGIRTPEKAIQACKAGADIIVVGNAIESDKMLVKNIADSVHGFGF